MPKSIQALAEQINPSPATISRRDEVSELHNSLRRLKRELGDRAQIMGDVLAATHVAPKLPTSYRPPKGKHAVGSPCAAVLHLTDWHIGETVQAEETEGFNAFNYEIAEKRVEKLGEKFLEWVNLHRNNYQVDECVVLATADFISGDIHPELLFTNEFPSPQQAVKSGYLFGNLMASLAPHFKKVRVEFITLDNHGRLTRKCQSSQGGYNNFSFIVAHIAKERVRQSASVEFNIYPFSSKVVNVAGRRYLLAHGHGIMGTWGIPWYGVQRKVGRESEARMNMPDEKHFDKLIIGHFHQPLFTRSWQIGGSLTGTTANDHKEGRHCEPCQTAWFTHPKHGEFDFTTFWL